MKHWLLKTEPGDYGYDDLEAEGSARWDGVKNNQALLFMREMKKGDDGLIYHTGKEKQIVGRFCVTKENYPDPDADNERFVVIDIKATGKLAAPVTLAAVKSDSAFDEFLLVRNSRLSVMPVPAPLWKRLLKMGGC